MGIRCTAFLILTGLLLAGCSSVASLREGERLYLGDETQYAPEADLPRAVRQKVEEVIAPEPNGRFLGMPISLWWYHAFYTKKKKGFARWWMNILGRPPVRYDRKQTLRVADLMENRLFNQGYFRAKAAVTLEERRKKVSAQFRVHPGLRFTLGQVRVEIRPDSLGRSIERALAQTKVLPGQPYRLEALRDARKAVANSLKKEGYYSFSEEFLLFRADTLQETGKANLTVSLKKNLSPVDLKPKYIHRVTVYPDFGTEDAEPAWQYELDGVEYRFTDLYVRPEVINREITLRRGDRYDQDRHNRSLKRLVNLGTFRFVNILFRAVEGSDSLLHMIIRLSVRDPNTLEGSVGLSYKTTGLIGPEFNANYVNRNLFNGAELLSLRGRLNLNYPVGQNNIGNQQNEYELNARITRPGLLLPTRKAGFGDKLIRANTKWDFSFLRERTRLPLSRLDLPADTALLVLRALGLNSLADQFEADPEFAPAVAVDEYKFTYGYLWERSPRFIHELNPFVLAFQTSTFSEPEVKDFVFWLLLFDALPDEVPDDGELDLSNFNVQRLLSLEPMLVFKPDYIFLHDSRREVVKRHNFFFRGRISPSGSLVFPASSTVLDSLGLFADDQLQVGFLQLETDTRYYFNFRERHTFATRLVVNTAVPLSNEFLLPYLDFYSVGGPNSLRPFGIRQIGPGNTPDTLRVLDIFAGRGDIKLELDLEYRYQALDWLELSTFLDIGNVWLYTSSSLDGNGQFRWNRFYEELGMGAGMGLRFTFDPLVLRFDLALPFSNPAQPPGQRWVLPRSQLRDLQFYIAFGYSI